MKTNYKTVYQGGTGEITEKKSRFIATILPIDSEQTAIEFIEEMKKKYWDASHNCSAYIVGSSPELQRCSDDGEPARTAGRPMLDLLLNEELHNVAVVVTRYFGGTLLGVGGLVRAYTDAVKEGLQNCILIEKQYALKLTIVTDYTGVGKLQYIAGQSGLQILSCTYTDIVTAILLVPPSEDGSFRKRFLEATNGKADITVSGECFFASINDEIQLFDE